jgi:hypothetical protein
VNVAVQTNVNVGAKEIAERLIQQFDHGRTAGRLSWRMMLGAAATAQPQ